MPTVIGTPNTSTTTSVTIPAHQAGDMLLVFGFNSGSNLAPVKPGASGTVPAWITIDSTTSGTDGCGLHLAYCIATATNETSGTWTAAARMMAVVVRNVATSPIGGHAEVGAGNAQGNNTNSPAITLANSDGSSLILCFYAKSGSGSMAWSAAPTGYTRVGSGISLGNGTCCNSKDLSTSDGVANQLTTNTGAGPISRSAQVEILAPVAVANAGQFFSMI